MKIGLFIPTYNAGDNFEKTLEKIEVAIKYSDLNVRKLVIDSFSDDDTVSFAQKYGFEIKTIRKDEFTHGEVRRRAANYLKDCEYIIYMTQDVMLNKSSIYELFKFIDTHDDVGIAYGKQVAGSDANFFDKEDRKYNYPNRSIIKGKKDVDKLGIKTVFSSDAFAIYRYKCLVSIGNFPGDVKFAEDMYMAAKAVNLGYKVGYCSESTVMHNNGLNISEQFRRYHNIGLFHRENQWIQEEFGKNESNGLRLVYSQTKNLIRSGNILKIPELMVRSAVKYFGYFSGNKLKK